MWIKHKLKKLFNFPTSFSKNYNIYTFFMLVILKRRIGEIRVACTWIILFSWSCVVKYFLEYLTVITCNGK